MRKNNEDFYLSKVEELGKKIAKVMEEHGFEIQDLTSINVIVSEKQDNPAIFMRRNTTDPLTIKRIMRAAYHRQPLIIQPQFTNTLQSLGTAIEKGMLYKEGDRYLFTF